MGEEGSRGLLTADVDQIENRSQTVAWLKRSGNLLRDFDLSATGQPLRRVAVGFGLQPIMVHGRVDFRAPCLLSVRAGAAVLRVFTPKVIDAFVSDPGRLIEGRGDEWLVYRPFERVPAERMPTFLDRAVGLVDGLGYR